MAKEDLEPEARGLYLAGIPIAEIAKKLGVHRKTLFDWKRKFNWENLMKERKEDIEKTLHEEFFKAKTATTKGLMIVFARMVNQFVSNGKVEDSNPQNIAKVAEAIEKITKIEKEQNITVLNEGVIDSKRLLQLAEEGKSMADNGEPRTNDAAGTGNTESVPEEERKGTR